MAGCLYAMSAAATTYVYHEGNGTVARVLSLNFENTLSHPVPILSKRNVSLSNDDLVVTVGLESFSQLCNEPGEENILALFIGEEEFIQASTECRERASAIWSGAPLSLRLDILSSFWEDSAPIAMIYSDDLQPDKTVLQRAETLYGFDIESYPIQSGSREESLKALTDVLDSSNLVMSLYDSQLFEPQFAKDSIRLMFHKQKALAAHSFQLVRSGALFAVYSTSRSKLALASLYIQNFESKRALPPPDYPKPLRITFNPYLIRLYGVVLPTDRYLFTSYGVCPELGCAEALY